jgi:hypothetical protein
VLLISCWTWFCAVRSEVIRHTLPLDSLTESEVMERAAAGSHQRGDRIVRDSSPYSDVAA